MTLRKAKPATSSLPPRRIAPQDGSPRRRPPEVRRLGVGEVHILYAEPEAKPERDEAAFQVAALREVLAERDRRIVDQERTIAELRGRIVAADVERQLPIQGFVPPETGSPPGSRRLHAAMRVVGRFLDFCAELMLPPMPDAGPARNVPLSVRRAEQTVAERVLLDEIRRWRPGRAAN